MGHLPSIFGGTSTFGGASLRRDLFSPVSPFPAPRALAYFSPRTEMVVAFSRASTLTLSGSAALAAAPLDSAETGIAKQGVNKADGSHRLVTVGPVGIMRIPAGRVVLDSEGVTA